MMETRVRVLHADQDMAWVETTEQNGCGACQAKSACAISGLGRFFTSRRQPIRVCASNARPGEQLTVVLSEADFLKAGLLAYLVPTLLAVASAAGASLGGAGDAWTAVAMAAGFIGGIALAARLASAPPMATCSDTFSSNQGETP